MGKFKRLGWRMGGAALIQKLRWWFTMCYQVGEPDIFLNSEQSFFPHLVQLYLWAQEHQFLYPFLDYISCVTVELWNRSGLTQKFIYHSCKFNQRPRGLCSLLTEAQSLYHCGQVASKISLVLTPSSQPARGWAGRLMVWQWWLRVHRASIGQRSFAWQRRLGNVVSQPEHPWGTATGYCKLPAPLWPTP